MSPEPRTAWIDVTSLDDPDLAPVYDAMRAARTPERQSDPISHFWQAQSLAPGPLAAHHALYRALWSDLAPLTTAQGEMIVVVVCAVNGAAYCVSHHGPQLAEALADPALAHAVAMDYRTANLAARDRVLLDHVVALTCEPSERTPADLERLREYGWSDLAILKATTLAAYYNMVSRIATVLGVALEPGVERWEFGSQK